MSAVSGAFTLTAPPARQSISRPSRSASASTAPCYASRNSSRTTRRHRASRRESCRTRCYSQPSAGAGEGHSPDRHRGFKQSLENCWNLQWKGSICSTGYQTDSEDDLPPLLDEEFYLTPEDDVYTPFPSRPEDFPEAMVDNHDTQLPRHWATLNGTAAIPSATDASPAATDATPSASAAEDHKETHLHKEAKQNQDDLNGSGSFTDPETAQPRVQLGGNSGRPQSILLSPADMPPQSHVPSWGNLGHVYVILFGVGETETEGIYSLRALSEEDGVFKDTIIAFQHQEDAERYASLLEASMPHAPTICPIDPAELLEFCVEAGYMCRLETEHTVLTPPTHNLSMTDWERSIRLRDGQYDVLDAEPVRAQDAQSGLDALRELSDILHNNIGGAGPLSTQCFDEDDWEDMRTRLECLLPQTPIEPPSSPDSGAEN